MISGLSRLSHFKTSFARASDWKFSEHAYMPAETAVLAQDLTIFGQVKTQMITF